MDIISCTMDVIMKVSCHSFSFDGNVRVLGLEIQCKKYCEMKTPS